jgi:hypothetical protein
MNLGLRTSVATPCLTGLLLATGLVAASCARHEERRVVAEAKEGTSEIVKLIANEEIGLARERFLQTHEPLHLTASEVESVDPDIAEVVNDITEVLEGSFQSEPLNRRELMDLAERTLARLDEAHYALDH